ncbi:MAG: hypothetical protein CMF75_09020 [Maricaulis sp.]|nr:hypothetical protein [Maricaulis sp.]|tara:strand:- start:116 stop:337 length:222 start_codon:yes stop_codon:yes gene_type:complete
MACKTNSVAGFGGDPARMAVQDWLETQARVTGYWRDLLVCGDGNDDLIAALDAHASFLAAAAHLGGADFYPTQ